MNNKMNKYEKENKHAMNYILKKLKKFKHSCKNLHELYKKKRIFDIFKSTSEINNEKHKCYYEYVILCFLKNLVNLKNIYLSLGINVDNALVISGKCLLEGHKHYFILRRNKLSLNEYVKKLKFTCRFLRRAYSLESSNSTYNESVEKIDDNNTYTYVQDPDTIKIFSKNNSGKRIRANTLDSGKSYSSKSSMIKNRVHSGTSENYNSYNSYNSTSPIKKTMNEEKNSWSLFKS